MHNGSFRKELFDNLRRDVLVRILIYDPDSEVLVMRATDEKDKYVKIQTIGPKKTDGKWFEMQQEINSTLHTLAEDWKNLNELGRKNLEVRLTYQSSHPLQMVRADEQMLVAFYLSGKSGTPSPTMQFRGSKSTYFLKYMEQFETLWERAKPVDDKYFNEILQEFEVGLSPSIES